MGLNHMHIILPNYRHKTIKTVDYKSSSEPKPDAYNSAKPSAHKLGTTVHSKFKRLIDFNLSY